MCNVMDIACSLQESSPTQVLSLLVLSLSSSPLAKTHFCVNRAVPIGISSMQEEGVLSLRANVICDRANFVQSPNYLLDTDVSSCELCLGPLY